MKHIIAAAALALTGLLAVPSQADAGLEIHIGANNGYGHGHFSGSDYSRPAVSGHASCGCPIHVKRVFRGRDCYGRPIFDVVRVPFRCGGHHREPAYRSRDRHSGGTIEHHGTSYHRSGPPAWSSGRHGSERPSGHCRP